jgi:hypothetical protein
MPNEKKYEVYYKSGSKEIMSDDRLPTFSEMFNMQVRKLKIGEEMYEMTAGVIIKRIG